MRRAFLGVVGGAVGGVVGGVPGVVGEGLCGGVMRRGFV